MRRHGRCSNGIRAMHPCALSWVRILALFVLLPGAAVVGACSQHIGLYPQLEALQRGSAYAEAAELVRKNRSTYGERNAVLWNLDQGALLHYAGRYEESNQAFTRAERRIEELYQESISGHAAAFLTNDNSLPYPGEDFESVLIHLYKAINYAQLGQPESALVEARRVNEKLEYLNDQYDPDERNEYREDAFARLLAGVFYEIGGTRQDLNDAFISYRNSLRLYEQDFQPLYGNPVPLPLRSNLLATSVLLGASEHANWRNRFAEQAWLSLEQRRDLGRLYFIHFVGLSPEKQEVRIDLSLPSGDVFSMAAPAYRERHYRVHGARIHRNGEPALRLEVAHPTGAIALKNLDNRMGRITAKALARGTTKTALQRSLRKRADRKGASGGDFLAYLVAVVFTVASEQADLRAWQTLPDQILFGQLFVPPGRHRLQVDFIDAQGNAIAQQDLGEVELAPGATRFFVLRSIQ